MAISHPCFLNLKVHKTDYLKIDEVVRSSTPPSSPPTWRRRVFFPPKPQLLRSLTVKNSAAAAAPELVVERGKKTTTTTTSTGVCNHDDKKVPVFVMLPLDTVTGGGELKDRGLLESGLSVLKRSGVEGVMVDAWWGLVENEAPLSYKWGPYVELVHLLQSLGLKLQVVMSFHQCGGNVGDNCSIPLPQWVREEIDRNQDLVYTDRSGRRNPEYISLGCDSLPVLRGRTPIEVYNDFMKSFRQKFQNYFGNVIVEVQVGMGPCGELRYPSYPESNGIWRFPGIGEFQCYDKYMRASLAESAEAIGKREWGSSGPHDAGEYNQFPEETRFFRRDGNWNTDYGHFFLSWYSGQLLSHGEALLAAAREAFVGIAGLKISCKIAGIHWHYGTRSHAAELTAGYYNTRDHDGYRPIAEMFSRHGAVFDFTCVEMRDAEQKPEEARCSPEGLVRQVKAAVREAGIELAGENALERYDPWAYGRVLETAAADDGGLCSFTYLRMNDQLLLNGDNLANFSQFVDRMSECRRNSRREMSFSLL